jgi:threonine/homoserine/homoserine lactone efflux protein
MTFLPTPDVLAAFTLAAFVLILTPGPDMTLFLGETLRGGRTRGSAALLGASTGFLAHTMLAALGLSALLAASTAAYTVLKIIGAVYLVWLAVQSVRHGSALTIEREPRLRRTLAQSYLMGLGINLLNPKIVFFFLTFLPQFVDAGDPHAGAKLLFFGLYFISLGVPTCLLLIFTADRFTAAIRRSPRVMRVIDWAFAGLMGAFAARLLLSRGN